MSYTVVEVAHMLNVRPSHVRFWIHSGQLQATKATSRFRITKSDLEDFIKENYG